MIVMAASIIDDIMYLGFSHAEIFQALYNIHYKTNPSEKLRLAMVRAEQGFLTDKQEFVTREEEALRHVLECGQPYNHETIKENNCFQNIYFYKELLN